MLNQFIAIFDLKSNWRLLLGPAAASFAFFLCYQFTGLSGAACIVAAIAVLCACWWILEPVPIPVTSLIPLALLPLFNVLTPSQVAEAYGHPIILLLMAGCILSTAMSHSGAHKKIALFMLHVCGENSPKRVVLGFMLASAVLSMWISNTATTLMLLPVALAVVSSSNSSAFSIPLLLGICYAASIGGMGTPIGTPPNLILMRVYEESTGESISFVSWMLWCVPVVIVFIPLAWLWLTRNIKEPVEFTLPKKEVWSTEQKRVLIVFALTALAWITRTEPFGGWREWLGLTKANDASVAMIAVIVMFIVPAGNGKKLLNWETAVKIPWGMLLLFSGGIALAKGFSESGLAEYLANGLTGVAALPMIFMIALICLVVTFLTEVTSNTASTALLMPVLAAAAYATGTPALLMMLPAALSASCAFMLPVATAPNAIIYGSHHVPIQAMVRQGVVMNLIGVIVITLIVSAVFY